MLPHNQSIERTRSAAACGSAGSAWCRAAQLTPVRRPRHVERCISLRFRPRRCPSCSECSEVLGSGIIELSELQAARSRAARLIICTGSETCSNQKIPRPSKIPILRGPESSDAIMIIKPTDRKIRNLFQESFYAIPRFQRPYSWKREQLEEFWDDAIRSDEQDYFIGSMVVYPDGARENYFNVVDGQQRLTTVVLLLAVIRDFFRREGFDDSARGVQAIIERPDLDNKLQFTLESQTPYPYLQDHIQKYGQPETELVLGEEEKKLRFAFQFFEEMVSDAVASIRIDSTVNEDEKGARIHKVLEELRNKVLRLTVILVTLSDEDDAYIIFETLNTRGMDLGVSDLVKNHLTRLLKPTNKVLMPPRTSFWPF